MAGSRWLAGQSAFWGLDIGPNPTDRAKNGTKINLLVEGQGGPLAVQTAPANWHDSVCLEDLLNSIVVELPDAEQHLCLDKGYDNPTARSTLQATDYVPHVAAIRPDTGPPRVGRRKKRRGSRLYHLEQVDCLARI